MLAKKNSDSRLNIAGISLNNINLNYDDAQTKTKVNITKLKLNTGKINEKIPVTIDSSMHVIMPETGLGVDISTGVTAQNLLNNTGIKFEVNDFNITGKLSQDNPMPLDISVKQTRTYRFN